MSRNDLSLSYRVDFLPRRTKKTTVLRRMEEFIVDGEPLPETWQITLRWRNSRKQEWREADFESAISDSRANFNQLVLGRIRRDKALFTETQRTRIKQIETKFKRKRKVKKSKKRKTRKRSK